MRIIITRTNSENNDFINLVKDLDAYLKIIDGDEHNFYGMFNNIDVLKNVVIAYQNDQPVACGAIKQYDDNSMEIKRMFVSPVSRGNGYAHKVLQELENWAKELGYKRCILETGKRQVEAVSFYKKRSYKTIPNYGQYKTMENSICFEKML
jgi:GNAT superfamily N-acetyltransferase